jgi:hypothetical protein
MRAAAVAIVLAAAACSAEPPPPGTYLTPTEHLARASMALRGIRPSLAELDAVALHPSWLPRLVDRYLDSPEFGTTIRELHNEVLRLHPQLLNFTPPPAPPLQDISFSDMNGSIYDEPLRLIEDIVMTDQPYTRLVTADYTMADRTVATVWGLEHSDDDGWERTAWTDDRGAAGILASTALFLRYRSVASNFNRARANAISRSLLCHDFSDAEIRIDTSVDLSNSAVVADAVVNNPSCAGCHQAMDPLASYFTPFLQGTMSGALVPYPVNFYNPAAAADWTQTTHRPPGYFGAAPVGLAGLGQAIADDPRFARCAAVHFASYLTEQPARDLSPAWVAQLQDAFVRSGYNAKQLARAIVLSDPFRRASDPDPVAAEGVIGYQQARPQQLERMLRDLTGFVWQDDSQTLVRGYWRFGRVDYLDDDYFGFRVLAGGLDSWYVTEPTHTMSATASLVARQAARRAAAFVVDHDAGAAPADRWLFTRAAVDATDPRSVRAELAALHGRIYSQLVAPDDPVLDDAVALFDDALAASGDPRRAWTVTLTGMLSDLRALYY